MKKIKPFLRWVILAAVLLFLAKALVDNWQEVAAIRIGSTGWGFVAIAFFTTLLAHAWGGWVWGAILRNLNQKVSGLWAVRVYFTTNLAKYIPGNVWHFVGRVTAAQAVGVSLGIATLSVLLEPLLMAASALMLALLGLSQGSGTFQAKLLQITSLIVVLVGVHPRFLNLGLRYVKRMKAKGQPETSALEISRYPLIPLLGELGFLLLRGAGFAWIVAALLPLNLPQILPLLGAFSLAWLTGLVVPGAPGGLGVFEATAIALLNTQFPTGVILSAVALYRLVSTLAEVAGAGLASAVKSA